MNRRTATTVAGFVAIALLGGWGGYRLGTPAKVDPLPATQKDVPAQIEITHSFTSARQLLTEAETPAERYALALEIEAMPIAELRERFKELALADENKHRLDNRQLRSVLQHLRDRDPREAIRLVEEHFHGLKLAHAYYGIIDSWGRSNPHATLHWLSQNKLEDNSSNVLNASNGFLWEWAARDPKGALAAWLALPDPKLPDKGLTSSGAEHLARSAARTPEMRDAALELLLAQEATESRTAAIAGVLRTWAASSPLEEVSSWIESQQLTVKETNQIAVETAIAAAIDGDNEAGAWLTEIISGDQYKRSNLLDKFADEWSRDHPNDCAEWLATLEPSPENDWAIRGFLRWVEYSDPESGFHWTRKISDQKLRERLVKDFWNHWRRRAPIAAQEFTSQFDADERAWLEP